MHDFYVFKYVEERFTNVEETYLATLRILQTILRQVELPRCTSLPDLNYLCLVLVPTTVATALDTGLCRAS